MATFKFEGIDDVLEDLDTIKVDCPECENAFEFMISDIGVTVNCPHCQADIVLESKS